MVLPRTIEWIGDLDGHVAMIDQTLLPGELKILQVRDLSTLISCIKRLAVRGAPAIGIAAAMGVVLGMRDDSSSDTAAIKERIRRVTAELIASRPTAVNLSWAAARMVSKFNALLEQSPREWKHGLLNEARAIRDEDAELCHAIGRHGETLIAPGSGVMTHCNAGHLATAEYGTALALMYTAHAKGRPFTVYANETRPLLQGARLTAWELSQAGIDVRLACDNMAASLMRQGKVQLVVTGADRIAANGDTANKIGTYGVAVLAHAHGIPFYVAAPSTTFDLSIPDGSHIPIEQRDPDEIRRGFGRLTAPDDIPCESPAFDVTPAQLIRGIITERGIIAPVDAANVGAHLTHPFIVTKPI